MKKFKEPDQNHFDQKESVIKRVTSGLLILRLADGL